MVNCEISNYNDAFQPCFRRFRAKGNNISLASLLEGVLINGLNMNARSTSELLDPKSLMVEPVRWRSPPVNVLMVNDVNILAKRSNALKHLPVTFSIKICCNTSRRCLFLPNC